MIIAIGIIIFVIGCCLSSYEDNAYSARREAQRRHEELMRILAEESKKDVVPSTRKRVTRRRIAQDKEGNVLAEELTEEEL